MPNHYTNILIGYPNRDDEDEYQSVILPSDTNLCQLVRPMPDELKDTKSPGDNPNWYDWQAENWGIKWGTYRCSVKELDGDGSPTLIEFITPWGPPSEDIRPLIVEWLEANANFKCLGWTGFNPYDNTLEEVFAVAPAGA